MTGPVDGAALAQRVQELEVENAKLKSKKISSNPVAGARWRSVVSAVCIVVASILVPASIIGGWARMQLVNEDAFVATLAPLIDDAAVQDLIADETMSAIRAQVDFGVLTDELFDAIVDLGVPPRASAALDILRQPAADGLTNIVESTLASAVASDVFSDVWATSARGAHKALTLASTSDGGGIIVLSRDGVGIATGPLIAELKETLTNRGVAVAALIPAVDRTIALGDGEALLTIRATYALVETTGQWLPFVTIGLFALGIAFARRRSTAVVGAGIGTALGSGALGVVLLLGSAGVGVAAGELSLAPLGVEAIYMHLTGGIRSSVWLFMVLGILMAIGGWVCGRSALALKTRGAVVAVTASVRQNLAERRSRNAQSRSDALDSSESKVQL
ncbi:hypothetical protein [Microbacterium sp. A84]|uniref:hypothetical protein n=1 Tax=Microbacterium sp. A84 TaxID=3450715 RepID=UPI003F421848